MAAITAEGLVKVFPSRSGEVRALDGVDLEVPTGSVLGLLGPNGAGKTTAVRILTTLLTPDAGRATVNGIDVATDPQGVRRSIGLSGQYAAVDEYLTGRENLVMVGRLYHFDMATSRARATELLEQFDLVEAADRPAKTYSGGMRRRLDLAGALVARPPIIFLDEPTTGLDPRSRIGLWEVIEGLVAQGTTVLLTTQYLDEADKLADSIAVVDRGRVIARGTSDELKAQVGGERLAVTVAAGQVWDAREVLSGLANGVIDVDEHSRQLVAPVAGGATALLEAVRAFDEKGVHILDIGVRRPTLDDVFLELTGRHAEADEASDAASSQGGGARGTAPVANPAGATEGRHDGGDQPMSALGQTLSDTRTITWRNVTRLRRQPDSIVFGIIQSIMFVLLFAFVFGGAIEVPGGGDYTDYLMGGIFVQTVAFTCATTCIAMADDLSRGLFDRFRSLPMARSAVLAGRTFADLAFAGVTTAAMALTGLLVGWRTDAPAVSVLGAFALLALFAYSFLWIGAVIGLSVRSVEVAQTAGLIWLFPLTFLSNAFVPLETMPSWLQPVAAWNPISAVAAAVRELFGNVPPNYQAPDYWPLQNPVLASVLWCLVLLAIFVPLGVARYRRAASR